MLELDHLKHEMVGNLPLGSKKRLELAMAFTTDPTVLLLDEPFAGLSDHEIDEVVTVLKKYTHDKTIPDRRAQDIQADGLRRPARRDARGSGHLLRGL